MVFFPLGCLLNVMTARAGSVYELCSYTVLFAVSMSFVRPVYSAYLGDLFPPEHRSRANGVNLFSNGVAGGLGLLSMGPLLEAHGLLAVMLVMSTVSLLLMSVPMLLVKEGRKAQMRATAASSRSTQMQRLNASEPGGQEEASSAAAPAPDASDPVGGSPVLASAEEVAAAPEARKKQTGVLANVLTIWRGSQRSCFFVLVAVLFIDVASASIQAGLISFAVYEIGISPGYTLFYVAMFAGTYTLVAIPAGSVKDRTRRFRLVNISMLSLVAIAPVAFFAVTNKWTFGAALTLLGGFSACVTVNMQPLIYDEGSKGVDIGALTGLYYFVLSAGSISGKLLTGLIGEIFGRYRGIFLGGGVAIGMACICMNIAFYLGNQPGGRLMEPGSKDEKSLKAKASPSPVPQLATIDHIEEMTAI